MYIYIHLLPTIHIVKISEKIGEGGALAIPKESTRDCIIGPQPCTLINCVFGCTVEMLKINFAFIKVILVIKKYVFRSFKKKLCYYSIFFYIQFYYLQLILSEVKT